ncbi:hypothetical protein X740_29045 [Mesorhizobium sp. LNHC221B00]|nr:hypothetical protein X740_29045 [Mesorhizobium sp. LNHC221B00]
MVSQDASRHHQKQKARSTDRASHFERPMRQAAQGGGFEPGDVAGAADTAESLSRFCQLGFSYFFTGWCPPR